MEFKYTVILKNDNFEQTLFSNSRNSMKFLKNHKEYDECLVLDSKHGYIVSWSKWDVERKKYYRCFVGWKMKFVNQ